MEKRLFNFGVPWEHNISFSQGASVRGGRWILLSGQASPDDDVKLNVYTTDCRAFHKTQPIREAFFPRPYPAQTLVEVTRLAMRDFLVELEVIAVVPD